MTVSNWEEDASPDDFKEYMEQAVEVQNGEVLLEAEVRREAESMIKTFGYEPESETGLLSLLAGYALCGTSTGNWEDAISKLVSENTGVGVSSLSEVASLVRKEGTEALAPLNETAPKQRGGPPHRRANAYFAHESVSSAATDLELNGKTISSLTGFFNSLQEEKEQVEDDLLAQGVSAKSADQWARTQTFLHTLQLVRADRNPGTGIRRFNRISAFDWLEFVVRVADKEWLAPHTVLPEFVDSGGPKSSFEAIYQIDVDSSTGIQILQSLTRYARNEIGMSDPGIVFDIETCLCVYRHRLKKNDTWWRDAEVGKRNSGC